MAGVGGGGGGSAARAEAAMRRELEMARHERRERKEKEKREREEGCGIINCLARPLIVGEKREPMKMIYQEITVLCCFLLHSGSPCV